MENHFNLCYIIALLLVLACVVKCAFCKIKKQPIRLGSFSVEDTKPLRGIMACLIIICHVSFKFDSGHYSWPFTSLGAAIVSVFLFLSGYGLTVSFEKKGNEYLKGFIPRELKKLLPPFLIASAIWIAISSYLFDGNITEALIGFICFAPPLPYSWFVYALIILYLAFYITFRLLSNTSINLKLISIFCITFAYVVIFRMFEFGVFWYISLFAFNVGTVYGAYHKTINRILETKTLTLCVCTFIMLSIMIALGLRSALLAVIPIAVVLPVLIIGSGKNWKPMAFLGNISYEIYLTHGIFVPILALFNLQWYTYVILALCLSIITAIPVKILSQRITRFLMNPITT